MAEDCHCCDRHEETLEDIPCLEPPSNAVFLEPSGRSRLEDRSIGSKAQSELPTHYHECHYPMQQIAGYDLQARLREPEKVAQRLGSVKFIGWRCPYCNESAREPLFHIRGYIQNSSFLECLTCEELTLERTESIVQQPTTSSAGTSCQFAFCTHAPPRTQGA